MNPAAHILSFPITQYFGGPDGSISGRHTGMDFAMNVGVPLYSLCDGTVCYTSDGTLPPSNINYAQGISVMIQDDTGARWWFAHLSRMDMWLGERVTLGQSVGLSGVSGTATGPHLHLELQSYPQVPINPLPRLEEEAMADYIPRAEFEEYQKNVRETIDSLKAAYDPIAAKFPTHTHPEGVTGVPEAQT